MAASNADLIMSSRARIREISGQAIQELAGPLFDERNLLDEFLTQIDAIVAEVADDLRRSSCATSVSLACGHGAGSRGRADPEQGRIFSGQERISLEPVRRIAASAARRKLPFEETVRALDEAFTAMTDATLELMAGNDASPRELGYAVRALNRAVQARIGAVSAAFVDARLRESAQAEVQERHRIARDLHDRVGNELGVVYQNLELCGTSEGARNLHRVVRAQEATQRAIEGIREMTAQIRTPRVRIPPLTAGIRETLTEFLRHTDPGDTDVRITVSGDESLVPPEALAAASLVIREALRNSLNHASAGNVRVWAQITSARLLAFVTDDGKGFDVGQVIEPWTEDPRTRGTWTGDTWDDGFWDDGPPADGPPARRSPVGGPPDGPPRHGPPGCGRPAKDVRWNGAPGGRAGHGGPWDTGPLTRLGMTSMRERVDLLGGSFTVTSVIGKGTRVELSIPL
ncbi:hypothetical protein DP939_09675 [Spongiactinospora rosea]|uniref:Signal transduction histidine kinase subgroup 3 dimerisation and phosphoacceptor domain-containing protein n=1 Tax=Spongiactinospora rosea TaxID=2248750 RepID=A0A366M3C9_9ACTN|nr:histidine kinase [Spongiactinospora rosea]RBQ20084.1 hypothetical protein DP939_09675 [Spongiactinospora rosea]